MDLYKQTQHIMKQYGIRADKSLGQNFLIDETVIQDVIAASHITKDDIVIEIGPGLGNLTQYLLEEAKKVIAIELDKRMMDLLKERFFLYSNFEMIQEDVLKVNLKEMIKRNKQENPDTNIMVVANLPYYITTPIVMKLLEDRLAIHSITVMVQKEVAQRLVATPGDKNSGAITYCVNYYAKPSMVRSVQRECFIPQPSVESEVIRLEIRKQPTVEVKQEYLFFKLIKIAFMQRRKTLVNAVSNSGLVPKEEIEQILESLQIDTRVRGEKLTLEQFAQISDKIQEKRQRVDYDKKRK